VKLDKAYLISGVVVEKMTGKPLGGIRMTARAPDEGAFGDFYNGMTGVDGIFEIREIPPGTYDVSFGGQWQDADSLVREFIPVTVTVEAGTTDVRIEAVRGLEISGEIRDASGALVKEPFGVTAMARTARGDPDYSTRRISNSADDGTFRFTGLTPGRYDLSFKPKKSADDRSMVSAKKLEGIAAGTRDLVVNLTDGSPIRGRIVDEDGEPVTVIGNLYIYPAGSMAGSQGSLIVSLTEGTGVFTTPAVDTTVAYEIYATHFEGYMSVKVEGVYSGDAEIIVTLEKAGTITGHVEDENGKRMTMGLSVLARATDKAVLGKKGAAWATYTKPDGSFVISNLGPYEFELAAGGSSSPFIAAKVVTGIKPGTKDVVLVVKKGVTITGKLVDKEGNPVQTHYLAGNAVGGLYASASTRVSADGLFTMRGIPAGRVRFYAMVGGASIALGTVDAPATDVTLRLPK